MKMKNRQNQWIIDKRARKQAKRLGHKRPRQQGPRAHLHSC